MIPKKIHYCWFGRKPLPKLALKCIKSWKKFLPDYEIIEWNENNFDVNICPYTKEAYQAKKYAYVSDYARFWILYHYGGIYLDTDVEIIRPLESLINKGAFMGCEIKTTNTPWPQIASGLGIGASAKHPIYKEILEHYEQSHFILESGDLNYSTVVERVTNIFIKHGLKQTDEIQECDGITIYPPDYFCPKSYIDRKIHITSNTVSIHHYDASWMTGSFIFNVLMKIFGTELTFKIKNILKK